MARLLDFLSRSVRPQAGQPPPRTGPAPVAGAPSAKLDGRAADLSDLYARYPALRKVETSVDHRLAGRERIIELMPRRAVGAEIGVFTGLFTERLIARTDPARLYLVDVWHLLYGERFPSWGPYTDDGRLETAAALAAVRKRVGDRPGVEIVVSDSLSWIKALPNDHLDWAYLDTSHQYQATLDELEALGPKLRRNGVILGDDCYTARGNRFYGVFQAVTDFCKTRPFELFRLDHDAQWAIRRRP